MEMRLQHFAQSVLLIILELQRLSLGLVDVQPEGTSVILELKSTKLTTTFKHQVRRYNLTLSPDDGLAHSGRDTELDARGDLHDEFNTKNMTKIQALKRNSWKKFREKHQWIGPPYDALDSYLRTIFVVSFLYAHELIELYPNIYDSIEVLPFYNKTIDQLVANKLIYKLWLNYKKQFRKGYSTAEEKFRQAIFSINLLRYNLRENYQGPVQFKLKFDESMDQTLEEGRVPDVRMELVD